MNEASTLEILRQLEFFRGMAENDLAKLAGIAELKEFGPREAIFHEHDIARKVYLVIRGKVSLAICAPKVGCRQIGEVSDGELIGWSPLLERPRLSDTATTTTATRVLEFDAPQLLALCDADPEFGYHFRRRMADVLAQRLHSARRHLFEVWGGRLPEVMGYTD